MLRRLKLFHMLSVLAGILQTSAPAIAQDTQADIHAAVSDLILGQPAFSASSIAGPGAGPVWTTKNISYLGSGCTLGWTRDFMFSLGKGGDPALAKSFDERFSGVKSFLVDLSQIDKIEKTATAPNNLDGVDYALSEIIFRGDGIISGMAPVPMSGIIIGGEEIRDKLFSLLWKLHQTCHAVP